jgi:hypothetical protein
MRRISLITGLACFLAISSVGRADQSASDSTTGQSTTEVQPERSGLLGNEKLAVIPQVGFMSYSDFQGNTVGRAAYGATIDVNIPVPTPSGAWSTAFETGIFASHMGPATSNFFGSNPNTTLASNNAAGANMLLFPVDLKVGYVINDMFDIGAHGGLNFTYRSVGNATYFGSSTNTTSSVWRPYPNVGGDVQIQFLKNMAFILRPDVTITPGNDLFTGTIGLNFFLG